MEAPSNMPQQPEASRLAEAFRIFNQASEELAGAYTSLQEQVAHLTAELAMANGRLKREYEEKAALTERLALLLDTLPAGVAVLDVCGRVEQANPAAAAILGADVEGRAWDEFAAGNLEATSTPGEAEMARRGGRRVAVTETRLASSGGRIVLIHDVTEAHRMKTQAARNERLAAMGEMAAGLAHQLRTPLAAALLYAGALENPDLSRADRVRCSARVVERLQHLERLIRDMLTFARGETTSGETIPVSALLAELVQVFEPVARSRGVTFTLRDESPGLAVSGNRKALTSALTSLLENALDACTTGVRVGLACSAGVHAGLACNSGGRVELHAEARDGAAVFQVRDDGRGMDAATQARLFEPFFTTRAEGTGLGLAIARGVARAHGGAIEVESAPDAGSAFILTLPRLRVGAGSPAPTDAHAHTFHARSPSCLSV